MRNLVFTRTACDIGAEGLATTCHAGGFDGFAPPASVATGDSPSPVAVGDLNGDGIPDLATTDQMNDLIHIHYGSGGGAFDPPVPVASANQPVAVELHDINNDGALDLVVLNRTVSAAEFVSAVSVQLNQDNTFIAPVEYRMGSLSEAFTAGDLNGDGLEDLVTGDGANDTVSVRLGNAGGGFGPREAYPSEMRPDKTKIADVTGDGLPDVVSIGGSDPRFYVHPGSGDGPLGAAQTFTLPQRVGDFALVDLDGDGVLDFVGSTGLSVGYVRMGTGGGAFAPAVTLTFTGDGFVFLEDLAVSDFNGDGAQDLAVVEGSGGRLFLRLGNGDGTLQPQLEYACGNGPVGIVAADLNNDSAPDLVVSNRSNAQLSVLLNQTSFKPEPFALLAPANGAEDLALPEMLAGWEPARLRWEASTSFPTYRVMIATDHQLRFPILVVEGLTETSFEIPSGLLEPDTLYYWSVDAFTPGGAAGSVPRSFTFTTTKPADLNNDGVVDTFDLAALLAAWGF